MPRPTNTDERRRQISAGLAEVMARTGYESATIADVARASGLTPGLVHYHFQNKLEILLTLAAELRERHLGRVAAALRSANTDPELELVAFIDSHLALDDRTDPKELACWIVIGAEAIRAPRVRVEYEATLRALLQILEGVIQRVARARKSRSVEPESAAVAIMAAIQGYFNIAGSARELIPPGSAAPAVQRMARGLIGVDATKPRRAAKRGEK